MVDRKKGITPSGSAARSARQGVRRPTVMPAGRLTQKEIDEADAVIAEFERFRPKTRADCKDGPRPCPWLSCKFHLYLDVNPKNGALKKNFPDLEPWELKETCALDVADQGPSTLEIVGEYLNLTRERIRQLETDGKQKLQDEYVKLHGKKNPVLE